ncbi:DNA-binding protein [Mucilaginibacter sp. Bleaf8]|uniref:glycosyl hydrolase n=1 Tax=Mucilaginibacter sp. Bleaf8 TaxID=2834430 RepID=UPI001BCC45FE|nr:glycosyl hydrolase [Mucilaginibacter sp. Bleaf8]MBS7564914.1 DNA-binding protein [Mucilaginibacter sp. Bleaf8]
MKKNILIVSVYLSCTLAAMQGFAQFRGKAPAKDDLARLFKHPPESAKPWVFWYWMQASVSKVGITADLEAMKQAGLGGAYLMPIKGAANPPFINPPIVQLTPEWWDMIRYTFREADRLGLKLALHDCDGFALAGGPWITPELSMQKVVWTKTQITGGKLFNDTLQRPENYKGYYKDIAVMAYPSVQGAGVSTNTVIPKITTSLPGVDAQYLAVPGNKKNFSTADSCWIQLAFDKPFTCRSLVIHTNSSNYQAERLLLEVSDDGKVFRSLGRLEPPRHGWQDGDAEITHSITPTTARYFRFVYNKEGSEPGADDLDFAKWKPSLKLTGIELSAEPRIHQFEGKSGAVWRISKHTTSLQLCNDLCIPQNQIVNLTDKLDAQGHLHWQAPAGNWTILRMGHTSTGHTNATAGGGMGLECDKFNPEAARIQFKNWFGEAIKQVGPDMAKRILKIFHVDSWECGSQNWSPVFRQEFQKRRGYDLLPYLPVMAGIPVESAEQSEKVLSDVRQTIAELLVDNFYGTMAKLAHEQGCTFSGESVAPTMTSDGMLHYSQVDLPMGEFWLRSPTHDKPNDMLDAISGGHIYGKKIIGAESFTELRTMWDEHPAMLKAAADRNLALGVNRFVFHVNTHNPWMDRKPGFTLDGIGLFMQRDQTWWKPGRAWIEYMQRCQALLQQGRPVVDIAVFTGEDIPRRAVLPDRLVPVLPGLFGKERVQAEQVRLANAGVPLRTMPIGVTSSANMTDAGQWVNPLHGYAYDSFNMDALMRLAKVSNGRIELPGGASYKVLVVPGATRMSPNGNVLSAQVTQRLQELVNAGATIVIGNEMQVKQSGKGRVLNVPYQPATFDEVGLAPDVICKGSSGTIAEGIAWSHHTSGSFDIYFISNQADKQRAVNLSLRTTGRIPELFDPVTGLTRQAKSWQQVNGRTIVPVQLSENGSVFIVFKRLVQTLKNQSLQTNNVPAVQTLLTPKPNWDVTFDAKMGGPKAPVKFTSLHDWSTATDSAIKYYSGTAIYRQQFSWKNTVKGDVWLNVGTVYNLAEVYVNNIPCGVAWTAPYRVNISKALKLGTNTIRIEVTNTWANRLMGDHGLPIEKQVTWTNAPYRLDGKSLLPAGLIGPVVIEQLKW